MIDSKTCTRCKEAKPVDNFALDATRKGGRHSHCRACRTWYARQHRAVAFGLIERPNKRWKVKVSNDLRVAARGYAKRARAQRKMALLSHYSGGDVKCACCGEREVAFLAIDHTNGGGNKHRKELGISSGAEFYKWLVDSGFPDGFRVLCHNCNFAMGHYGSCPHSVANVGAA